MLVGDKIASYVSPSVIIPEGRTSERKELDLANMSKAERLDGPVFSALGEDPLDSTTRKAVRWTRGQLRGTAFL